PRGSRVHGNGGRRKTAASTDQDSAADDDVFFAVGPGRRKAHRPIKIGDDRGVGARGELRGEATPKRDSRTHPPRLPARPGPYPERVQETGGRAAGPDGTGLEQGGDEPGRRIQRRQRTPAGGGGGLLNQGCAGPAEPEVAQAAGQRPADFIREGPVMP